MMDTFEFLVSMVYTMTILEKGPFSVVLTDGEMKGSM